MSNKLYVGNLPFTATEDGVRCTVVRVLPDAVGVQLGLRFDRSEADSRGRLLAMLA